jgi:hypothetical protein
MRTWDEVYESLKTLESMPRNGLPRELEDWLFSAYDARGGAVVEARRSRY